MELTIPSANMQAFRTLMSLLSALRNLKSFGIVHAEISSFLGSLFSRLSCRDFDVVETSGSWATPVTSPQARSNSPLPPSTIPHAIQTQPDVAYTTSRKRSAIPRAQVPDDCTRHSLWTATRGQESLPGSPHWKDSMNPTRAPDGEVHPLKIPQQGHPPCIYLAWHELPSTSVFGWL